MRFPTKFSFLRDPELGTEQARNGRLSTYLSGISTHYLGNVIEFLSDRNGGRGEKVLEIVRVTLGHASKLKIFYNAKLLYRFGYSFVPQVIRSHVWNDHLPQIQRYETSYMDGLRGCAALVIFNYHYFYAFSDMCTKPWGDEKHRYFIEMPLVRIITSGVPMLSFFFVTAGYVLSMKGFQLMQTNTAHARDKLLQGLSGSAFRRVFRVYFPVLAIMLIANMLAYLGAFEFGRRRISSAKTYFRNGVWGPEPQIPRFDTIGQQLYFLGQDLKQMTDYWSFRHHYPITDSHLWTIKVEVRTSLTLYAVMLGVARFHAYLRLAAMFAITLYCVQWERFEIYPFFWGAFLAQMDVLRQANIEKPPTMPAEKVETVPLISESGSQSQSSLPAWTQPNHAKLQTLRNGVQLMAFLATLWLMTSPMMGYEDAWGYATITSWTPNFDKRGQFIPSAGACIFILLLCLTSPTSLYRKFFNLSFPQYMGRIMFAFYLVHGSVLHMFGYSIPHLVWDLIGDYKTSLWIWVVGLVVGWSISLTASIWVAEIFTREIIYRGMYLAAWLESVCFTKLG